MYQPVSFTVFVDAFRSAGRKNQFSYEALRALFDYFEELEADTGTPIELDVIAICCEYAEADYAEIARDYDIDIWSLSKDEAIEAVDQYLEGCSNFHAKTDDDTFVYATF